MWTKTSRSKSKDLSHHHNPPYINTYTKAVEEIQQRVHIHRQTIFFLNCNLPLKWLPTDNELDYETPPFIKVYKNGHVERLRGTDSIPAMNPVRKAYVARSSPLVCPSRPSDDPWVNPMVERRPTLAGLGCSRVLVSVAEKDILKDRGWLYFQVLGRSGWAGVVEIHEAEGEGHCFHLHDMNCEKAKERMRRMADFFNRDMPPAV